MSNTLTDKFETPDDKSKEEIINDKPVDNESKEK